MADDDDPDGWVTVRRRVIYGDTDAMGVVYYGNYLRFLEVGRAEYIRARGGSYREVEAAGFRLPVCEVHLVYHASARYDDELDVAARVDAVSRASLTFAYRLTRAPDGLVLATGSTRHACLDERGRVVRLPDAITRFLPAAASGAHSSGPGSSTRPA